MKSKLFTIMMKMKSSHSAALQALGFSKDFVRNYSPIHKLLTSVSFKLAVSMREGAAA